MLKLFERIRAAARIAGAVLVTGETGTGKELVARLIHGWSERANGKFVAVDCGAMPEELIESELFGHRRGAFTSALADKPGLFEEANGGTLFLDEIGNTSKRFQVKLLRALQEHQDSTPVGDLIPRKVDIRVIAATNAELASMVRRGDFREDLYYRLNVFPIQVPPLRRRTEDVPLLVEHIARGRKTFSEAALRKLQGYAFPGNVRELENIVESAVYSVTGDVVESSDILLPGENLVDERCDIRIDNFWDSVARPFSNRQITRNHVESLIRQGLAQTNGSYRRLMTHFKMPDTDYKRFMDFLRRHRCNVDYREYRKNNLE